MGGNSFYFYRKKKTKIFVKNSDEVQEIFNRFF